MCIDAQQALRSIERVIGESLEGDSSLVRLGDHEHGELVAVVSPITRSMERSAC